MEAIVYWRWVLLKAFFPTSSSTEEKLNDIPFTVRRTIWSIEYGAFVLWWKNLWTHQENLSRIVDAAAGDQRSWPIVRRTAGTASILHFLRQLHAGTIPANGLHLTIISMRYRIWTNLTNRKKERNAIVAMILISIFLSLTLSIDCPYIWWQSWTLILLWIVDIYMSYTYILHGSILWFF